MQVIHALQPLPKSIFLAGPTPRRPEVPTWRKEALELLEKGGFDGTVFVPEAENWAPHDHYNNQIQWEWGALERSALIVFWVPRDLEDMPAFTTNVEFGYWVSSGKVMLGWPTEARKMNYLSALAMRYNIDTFGTLPALIHGAIERLRWSDALRSVGSA